MQRMDTDKNPFINDNQASRVIKYKNNKVANYKQEEILYTEQEPKTKQILYHKKKKSKSAKIVVEKVDSIKSICTENHEDLNQSIDKKPKDNKLNLLFCCVKQSNEQNYKNVQYKQIKDIKDYYILKDTIGIGKLAQVRLAQKKGFLNQQVALKIVTRDLKKNNDDEILKELHIMRQIKHKNIVEVKEILRDGYHYILVTDYYTEGSLHDIIMQKKRKFQQPMQENHIRYVALQLFETLQYLHDKKIVHRDIKIENLMIYKWNDQGPVIKLIDFDMSEQMIGWKSFNTYQKSSYTNHSPPELINMEPYSFAIDNWDACVVIYMLLCHELPFHDGGNELQFQQQIWKSVSNGAICFLQKGLTKDQYQRPTSNQNLQHHWIKQQIVQWK